MFGKYTNDLPVTDSISEKLVRLPLYPDLDVNEVIAGLKSYFNC